MTDFNSSARAFHGAFAAPITPAEARLRGKAKAYLGEDPTLERLLTLEVEAKAGNIVSRDELASLMSPERRMSLGYYIEAKAAAAEVAKLDAGVRR